MVSQASFSIKVAMIGYTSVGKSLIINTMLRSWYSQVKWDRSTTTQLEFPITVVKTLNEAGTSTSADAPDGSGVDAHNEGGVSKPVGAHNEGGASNLSGTHTDHGLPNFTFLVPQDGGHSTLVGTSKASDALVGASSDEGGSSKLVASEADGTSMLTDVPGKGASLTPLKRKQDSLLYAGNQSSTGVPSLKPSEFNAEARPIPEDLQDAVEHRGRSFTDAKATHHEICALNEAGSNNIIVDKKVFPVKLTKDKFFGGSRTNRPDTSITLVDLPGLDDEEHTDDYKQHLKNAWDSFDCFLVVIDVGQAHNCTSILEMVKNYSDQAKKKNVPIFILPNKVDSPKEWQTKVAKIYEKVEKVFGVSSREVKLVEVKKRGYLYLDFPFACPISARNAFVFLAAYDTENAEDFKQDKVIELFEEIGKEEVGRTEWETSDDYQRLKKAHTTLKKAYKTRIAETNFPTFMNVLAETICGEEAQARIINRQLEAALISLNAENVVEQLREIKEKKDTLLQSSESLPARFWEVYGDASDLCFEKFDAEGPAAVAGLGTLVHLLVQYDNLAAEHWPEERTEVVKKMLDLVKKQLKCLWTKCIHRDGAISNNPWNLSLDRWNVLLKRSLIASNSSTFRKHFEMEMFAIENLLQTIPVPLVGFPEAHNTHPSFDDMDHWGYISWKVCNFIDSNSKAGPP